MRKICLLLLLLPLACSAPVTEVPASIEEFDYSELSARKLASIFASLPLRDAQLREVFEAVSGSSSNGYDEEYTMDNLVSSPGAGVGGDKAQTSSGSRAGYDEPLRDMLRQRLQELMPTRGDVDDLMASIASSGYQLYWPYSEDWDGESYPVITFDPGYGAESNYGYALAPGPDGAVITDTLTVDEGMAMQRPVWVINSNSDAGFTPLELFSRSSTMSAQGAGCPVRPGMTGRTGESQPVVAAGSDRQSPSSRPRRLMLKSFKMLRNYDSWFGGASEFWIKCGCIESFNASTEAELKLYYPSVTDFMIVVKRKYVGKELPFEAIMVTDFTNQLDKLAFLIVEDDGGTRTNWKCSVVVKVESKSYGIEMDIPYNEKDDIVWRGQLTAAFFTEEDTVTGRFGDVVCTFELE